MYIYIYIYIYIYTCLVKDAYALRIGFRYRKMRTGPWTADCLTKSPEKRKVIRKVIK